MFRFQVYGMLIESSVPLPGVAPAHEDGTDVAFTLEMPVDRLPEVLAAPCVYALDHDRTRFFALYHLDGDHLLRWHRMFDFRVAADGSRICCTPLTGVPESTVRVYLMGRVLSFALHLKGAQTSTAAPSRHPVERWPFWAPVGWGSPRWPWPVSRAAGF